MGDLESPKIMSCRPWRPPPKQILPEIHGLFCGVMHERAIMGETEIKKSRNQVYKEPNLIIPIFLGIYFRLPRFVSNGSLFWAKVTLGDQSFLKNNMGTFAPPPQF